MSGGETGPFTTEGILDACADRSKNGVGGQVFGSAGGVASVEAEQSTPKGNWALVFCPESEGEDASADYFKEAR